MSREKIVVLVSVLALSLALGLVGGATEAGAAGLRGTLRVAGRTGQREKVSLTLAHRRLRFVLGWRANCDDGGPPLVGRVKTRTALRAGRRGAFTVNERGVAHGSDGARASYHARFVARVRRRKVVGAWALEVIGPSQTRGAYRCVTGTDRFALRKKVKRRARGAAALLAGTRGPLLDLTIRGPARRAGGGTTPPSPGQTPKKAGFLAKGTKGRIGFPRRDCAGAPPTDTPLAGAAVTLAAADGTLAGPYVTDHNGYFVDGADELREPVQVYVGFESPAVKVVPGDSGPFLDPYSIPMGRLRANGQLLTIADGPPAGAASIFWILQRAAEVTASLTPFPPPQAIALGRWSADLETWAGDVKGSFSNSDNSTITVGGTSDGEVQDQWEKWVLAHEYGHLVMKSVTGSPPGAGGDHDISATYPTEPALPWAEGFAHYLAAVVFGPRSTKGPEGGGCRMLMDLAARPAVVQGKTKVSTLPLPGQENYAQFQEINVAAALWQSAVKLGSGDAAAGSARVLSALHEFSTNYHAPQDTREARDALAEFAETSVTEFSADYQAFREQRIGWAMGAYLQGGFVNGLILGPYSCPPATPGGLGYPGVDECRLTDPTPPPGTSGNQPPGLAFPFLAGQAHRHGLFTLSMVYRCTPSDPNNDNCPAQETGTVIAQMGNGYLGYLQRETSGGSITLFRNKPKAVMQADAVGRCKLLTNDMDCGVAVGAP